MKISTKENAQLWIVVLVAALLVVVSDKIGSSEKWHAAIFWTACAFGPAAAGVRKRRDVWLFWVSWTILLTAHVAVMCFVFGVMLGNYKVISRLLTLPFAFGESMLLLGLIPALERRLTRMSG